MAEEVAYVLTLKDLLTQQLQKADVEAKKLEGTMESCKFAAAALAASAVAIGGAFVRSMVEAGTKVEDARVGLTTLLGDAGEANKVIKQTMEDATKTPFAFEGLLAANKALISAGESADASRQTVLDLANAIAATGGGDDELQRMVINLQQIRNTGQATALDIKQFAYAGVNIYKILADATNQPIEKVKDMKVSYEMLTMALKKAHEEGGAYAGGLENMANNTSVRISNLGDATFQLSVRMFDDLKPAIDSVINGGMKLIDFLGRSWDWTVKHSDAVESLAFGVGILAGGLVLYNGAIKAYAIYTGASALATELLTGFEMARATGMGVLTSAQWALNAAMNANPIGIIIAGLAVLGGALYYAYQKVEWFRGGVKAMWAAVKEVGSLIADWFTGIGSVISGIVTFDADEIKSGIMKMKDVVFNGAQQIGDAAAVGYAEGVRGGSERSSGAFGNSIMSAMNKMSGNKTAPVAGKKGGGNLDAEISPEKARPNKAVTINISIGNLIESFKVSTTTVEESTNKITEHVTRALTNAVNQAGIIADI